MSTLTLERRIAAPPPLVFEFLVDPERLVRWLGVAVDIDPRPGGRFHVDITGGDITEGTYLEIDPPRRVVFTWGWIDNPEVPPGSTTVRFDLRPDGDHTVLTLTHDDLPEPATEGHRAGWDYFLDRLQAAGAGRDIGPVDLSALDPEREQ